MFGEQGTERLQTVLLELAKNTNFLGILPLVYQIEAKHDASLEPFIKENVKSTFIIYDQDGKALEHYTIKPLAVMKTRRGEITADRDLGVMGYVLIPDNLETAKIPTLRFCFKGTDDKHTGKADIEIRAGAESYRRGERQILEQGSAVINDCHARLPEGKKFEVEVIGHSLGGALAELCFNTWQRTIAQRLAARTGVREKRCLETNK